MKPYYLIINPSRYPAYSRSLEKISGKISRGIIRKSRSSEHFRELIHEFCRSPVEDLIVWGGDGTANAAINGMMEEKSEWACSKNIGFLRGGSGNGIQDSYEVPIGLRKQVQTYLNSIEHGYTQEVDLLELDHGGERRYGQLVGLGLDAEVLDMRNRSRSEKLAKQAHQEDKAVRPGLPEYVKAGTRVISKGLGPYQMSIRSVLREGKYALRGVRTNAEVPFHEARFHSSAPLIEIGTRPYYGSFFKICPDVVCNDGYLGVYFYNFTSAARVLLNLFNLWKGRHHLINQHSAKKRLPLIERFEVKEAELSSRRRFKAHIDGDIITPVRGEKGYSLSVSIAPRALNFLVPETFYVKFHPVIMESRSSKVSAR
jgi:diacylglycerol kinase family enzyme